MKWHEFLDTAERLARGLTEGDWRSSISRAYYAIFHYFQEFLVAHGVDLGKAGVVHQNLKIGLLSCGMGSLQPIGVQVDRLLGTRSLADYKLASPVFQGEAVKAVQRARDVVAQFTAVLAGTPAATIASTIRAYLVGQQRIPH
jgi:uncharacterized protein (UPF0332 family)